MSVEAKLDFNGAVSQLLAVEQLGLEKNCLIARLRGQIKQDRHGGT
ncbi:hypothetical protein [Wenzhouxiangella limi]|nr:hypothetical protein [Wenzhouxiangella limi]